MEQHDAQRTAPVYNIKAVSHLTGVPADTLRRWESRYAVIAPQRTEGGYRLYSQRDVDTIQWLKARLQDGLSISRACDMLRQLGGDPGPSVGAGHEPAHADLLRRFVPHLPAAGPDLDTGIRSPEALAADLLAALMDVDEGRASLVFTEALGLYSLEDVLLKIVQPVLAQIGEAWVRGEIKVATEHFASGFVRERLSNIIHSSPQSGNGPLVLVACAPGELHEIGPMFLTVFLRRAGFKVVYLGQNVPLESLEGMIESMSPDAVCVSATRPETAAHLDRLRDFLAEKAGRGRSPLLAFGGQAFSLHPDIAERLDGTYLGHGADEAARRLSGLLAARGAAAR